MRQVLLLLALTAALFHGGDKPASRGSEIDRWAEERANQWYEEQPWLVGCNFIPSTAINQLEMWQQDSFDIETIDKELRWASGLGMNTVRVERGLLQLWAGLRKDADYMSLGFKAKRAGARGLAS